MKLDFLHSERYSLLLRKFHIEKGRMQNNRNLFILFSSILLLTLYSCGNKTDKEIKPIRYPGDYNRDFNDLNELHLASAKTIGIEPLSNRESVKKAGKRLKEISSGKVYEIDELTHSIPYLVPRAFELLEKIGINFSDSLKNLNAPSYKLIITSVTRTKEDVNKLSNRNINASSNSAHLYGTTFDISWKRFIKNDKRKQELTEDQLKKILASVLRDLQKQNVCYIKHERQQACFHITAR